MRGKFLLILLLLGFLPVMPVSSADLDGSAISFDTTVVGSGTVVKVTVQVANSTSPQIAGALVSLTVSSGSFSSKGQFDEISADSRSLTGFTPANGSLSVSWIAPEVNSTVPEISVGFSADISTSSFSGLVQNTLDVKAGLTDIQNSELTLPSRVSPGENFSILVTVKDAIGTVREGYDVSVDVSDGSPVNSQGAVSNQSGKVEILWTAPLLTIDTPNLTLSVRAFISASSLVNITLTEEVEVVLSNSSSINVVMPTISEVNEKSDNVLKFGLFVDGLSPATGGEIQLQVTDGLFYRLNTSTLGFVDDLGFVYVNWTAPQLPDIQPLDVNFRVEGRYVNLTIVEYINITVVPVIGNLTLEITVKDQVYKQNEQIVIDYFVYDTDTLNPTGGVVIFSTAEFGFFQESGLNEILVETDLRGEAQAVLNLTEAELVVQLQTVSIFANASKLKYNPSSTTIDVTVERVPKPDLKLDLDVDTLTPLNPDDTLEIGATVLHKSGESASNVTVEISADAGEFSNGELVLRGVTDSSGKITFTWAAKLDISVSTLNVTFSVTVVSDNYFDDPLVFQITVINPTATSSSQNIDTADANKETNTTVAVVGAIVTVAAAGAGIAVVLKKKQ